MVKHDKNDKKVNVDQKETKKMSRKTETTEKRMKAKKSEHKKMKTRSKPKEIKEIDTQTSDKTGVVAGKLPKYKKRKRTITTIKKKLGVLHVSGRRKKAIARATLKPGKGVIRINNILLQHYQPSLLKEKILEPLLLAQDVAKTVDIKVRVFGGGIAGQAEAARLAIARSLVSYNQSLKNLFLDYDRHLIVADVRHKELRKPNTHGKARAKRQKSYR